MKTTPMYESLETPTETDTQGHVYQKPVTYVDELKWRRTDSRNSSVENIMSRSALTASNIGVTLECGLPVIQGH